MLVDVVWLTATLLSFPLLTLCEPLFIMSTSQILKMETEQKVFVEVQDYGGSDTLSININVMNFPSKQSSLVSKSIDLNLNNKYQANVDIKIPFINTVFKADSEEQQYVYLRAVWGSQTLEKIVMVSFQPGYLFLQTDKTIYTPDTDVKYRIFSMNSFMKPMDNTVVVKVSTPEGIIVEQKSISVKKGVVTDIFKLGNPVRNGIWKIAAHFKENSYKNFTAEFEVKEYRLPSFDVSLTTDKSFFYADDESFSVQIKAKYLFGENVEGSAFVVFGVFQGNEKKSIQSSLDRVDIKKGEGRANLTRQQIIQTFPDILKLVGETLYISVSVLTNTGSEMVEAERRGIHIVTSPFTIQFTKTPRYFKPGMPFNFKVYVTNPDGTPAENINLLVSHEDKAGKTDLNGLASFHLNTKPSDTELKIKVETNEESLKGRVGSQAVNTFTAYTYKSSSKNYLHITLTTPVINVDSPSSFTLNIQTPSEDKIQDITYMILSKGQIVHTSKIKREKNNVITENIVITRQMLPSFRLLAYYHVGTTEVVADSILVDVKDTCNEQVHLNIQDPQPVYLPADQINLQVTAAPSASVYLVAVDKGVYVLNNKNRITQTKIWDIVEQHDIGCTAGSGKDAMGVFYDAGLLFITQTAGSTAERRVTTCAPDSKRKRRAITKSELISTLVSKYNDKLKKCCRDGLVENLLGYTCGRRAEYIEGEVECRQAFLHCCQRLADVRKAAVQEELHFARSEEKEANEMSDEITSRSVFPEIWMWDKEDIPSGTNVKIRDVTLPESITTWVLTAVSISQEGICVANPFELIVKKNFFIDLKLPYSTSVNEQIEIKVVIHNLNNKPMKKVYVELKETEDICSMASFKEKYRTTVSVDKQSSNAVSFVIIPLKAGNHKIEVKAFDLVSQVTDGVAKDLKVVTQGILTYTGEVTLILEPDKHGGRQRSDISRPFLKNQMPDTDAHTYIAVRGRPLSQMIEEAISGRGLETLIKQPSGCGEQNLMAMVLPLIATHYLDKTNQWSDVGVDKRVEALGYISTGIQTELTYQQDDHSFGMWPVSKGSTWLTAYVVKMFSLADELVTVNHKVICDAAEWLVTKTKSPEGMFTEVSSIGSSSMGGKSSGLTMTAFVLMALQEASRLCENNVPNYQQHLRSAANYIARNIDSTTDTYAVAMASYALARDGQLDTDHLFRFASSDRSNWPVKEGYFFTLEATGYALLALLETRDYEKAKPIADWLRRNQALGSGYRSTQATAVVFQAVAKYMTDKPKTKEGTMTVIVSSTARSTAFKGSFSKTDKNLQRSDKFLANGDLTVTASGQGEGSISVATLYYTKPGENYTKCNKFDLEVKMTRDKTASYPGALASYTLTIETRFLHETKEAAMTILDISLLTGFVADKDDLKKLMGVDKYINDFELNSQLSEKASVIIYLKKVSNKVKEKIAFKIHMMLKVGVSQPAAVSVYEYYNIENHCVKFYDPHMSQSSGSLYLICPKEVCSCAEANCPQLKGPAVPDEKLRIKEACHNKDFIYKATLEVVTRERSSDIYTFTIVRVIKEGTDKNVLNDPRDFYIHIACKDKLGLKEGKDYLIMGPEPKKIQDSWHYTIRTSSWLEYWPTQEESQDNKNNDGLRYIGLSSLSNLLENEGCTT
ncbi:complement C3-like [Silurus meridionalis]|uniref:complement C3-like n=1 Tax=Silurus meridionalis TaxID=175797 RepID=UPI001EE9C215|nr:complement C3-like [Silurus meridionalis]